MPICTSKQRHVLGGCKTTSGIVLQPSQPCQSLGGCASHSEDAKADNAFIGGCHSDGHLLEDVADEASAGAGEVLGHSAFPLVATAVLPAESAYSNVLLHVHLPGQRRCIH